MMAHMAASMIAAMGSSLIQPVASSLIKVISGKRFSRAGKGQEGIFTLLLALHLMMKFLGKGVRKAGRK